MVRRQRELNFEPGSQYLYSNAGYTLLAEIVAKVSGQSFREFTLERIFKPLGMSRTHFHDDHEMIVPGRAYSYAKDGAGYRNSVLSYANVGATSLFTTAEDLCRWLANFDDGRVGGSAATEQMHERGVLTGGKKLDYAFGLMHEKYRGVDLVGHSGGDAGFRAYAVRVPAHRLGIVVLSNLASFNPGGEARKVIDVVLADQLEAAPAEKIAQKGESEAVLIDPDVLDRYVGLFRLDTGMTVKLTRFGAQINVELGGGPKFALIASSPTEFFVKELNARVTFDPTGDKPADGITADVNEQKMRGTRVVPQKTADAEALVGVYFSPELETTYEIALVDGGLVARHQRHPDIPLTAVGEDEYAGSEWFFQKILFERGDDSQVTGLRLSGARVRNLRFQRMSNVRSAT